MRKELTLQIPVTAPAEISAQEVIEMTKIILALYEERYDLKQVEYGTPQVIAEKQAPDVLADEFQCPACGCIKNEDTRVKLITGAYACFGCFRKLTGVKRCEACDANLTLGDSVRREYVELSSQESAFVLGLYTTDGTFMPTTRADLSGGNYVLPDGSDSCAACGHPV